MPVKNLIQAMETVLANSYTLYLKTQNYHWNIAGEDFYPYHLMLEGQYKELGEAVDTLAERIRALGAHVLGSFASFTKLKTIDEAMVVATAEEMISDLYVDQEKIVKSLRNALDEAEQTDDVVTADLLTQRLAAHEKNHWMLGATVNKAHAKIKKVS